MVYLKIINKNVPIRAIVISMPKKYFSNFSNNVSCKESSWMSSVFLILIPPLYDFMFIVIVDGYEFLVTKI